MDAPTKWENLCNRIEILQADVLASRASIYDYSEQMSDFTQLTKKYFSDEWATRLKVDSLMDRIAANGIQIREEVPGDIACFAFIRLNCALDFSGMIFPPQSKASPFGELNWTAEEGFKWLTKDLWHRRFDHYLKLWAMGGSKLFPFYGIEPADPRDAE